MESKNQIIIVGLLALILGLLVGYFLGINTKLGQRNSANCPMYQQMTEQGVSYDDEIIDGDGAMTHAMDEMMLGFRGKTGVVYEEAFLRGMIVHHIGAVRMAQGLLEQTDRPELEAFAQDIISVQSEEIETMKNWLEAWFNNKNQ